MISENASFISLISSSDKSSKGSFQSIIPHEVHFLLCWSCFFHSCSHSTLSPHSITFNHAHHNELIPTLDRRN
jgi:hypothetical protein